MDSQADLWLALTVFLKLFSTEQMQSYSHVQHVWDSFVAHLKSLSESLQVAHDVFSHPEEDIKARLLCTIVRRK